MDTYQNQSSAMPMQTNEYGNPKGHTGTMGDYGTTGVGTHGVTGMLHRSGSPSSSSSEDDGLGGRRKKKGMKQKIKEKLPGTGNKGHTHDSPTTTHMTGSIGATGTEQHEKKGVLQKIKEKLLGGHH